VTSPQRPPLLLRPQRSRLLALWLITVHLLPFPALFLASLPSISRLLLLMLVGASFIHHWRVGILRRGGGAVVEVRWSSDGRWDLLDGAGVLHAAELVGDRILLPGLVLLNFSLGRFKRRSLILFSDAVDRDTHRRLRAELRMGGRRGSDAGEGDGEV